MMNPLPDLRSRDFNGCSIFHQVIDWHAPVAAQPGFEILQADADVVAQSCFGDGAIWYLQQIGCNNMNIFAFLVNLIRGLHYGVEFFHSNGYKAGMCYPGTIVTVVCLTMFVGANSRESFFVGLRVVLDWYLR